MDSPSLYNTVIYQIYPRSFCDANGDGIGDIPGIISKLDYLKDLGIETLWISPMYQGTQRDFGYDITNYRSIDPLFGTMEDCLALIEEVHRRDMYILFDMVLNHTSDQHPWFISSRSSRDDPKRDWYIWADGRGKRPPNNWQSMVHGSGWHYDPRTESWYWAAFLPFQPDLNWRNPEVQKEMLSVLQFWLDRGVDGFRLDIFDALYEQQHLRNNPFALKLLPNLERGYGMFQKQSCTRHLEETLETARMLRRTLKSPRDDLLLIGEVFAPLELQRAYCGRKQPDGLHSVFLFQAMEAPVRAQQYRRIIREAEAQLPPPYSPTWVFGNHDRRRSMERCRGKVPLAKLRALMQFTLRGYCCIYQGEEIGMRQHTLGTADSLDAVTHLLRSRYPDWLVTIIDRLMHGAVNRDNCRTPMLWEDSPNYGFSDPGVRPWLPHRAAGSSPTVQDQQGDPDSLFTCYRDLLSLRSIHPALREGTLELLDQTGSLLGYLRSCPAQKLRILLNFSSAPRPIQPGTLLYSTKNKPASNTLDPWEGVIMEV